MKFNHITGSLLAAVVIVASSCSDDLGNYSYKDINEVTVSSFDLEAGKTYNVIAHVDRLNFDPQISSSLGITDESNYEFEWRVMPTGAQTEDLKEEDIVIGRERRIDIPVTLAPTKYSCFFNVKDKSTGVTWSTPFYLQVRSLTAEGWFVLCDDNGWPRIDIIFNKDDKEDIIARDVLSGQEFHPGKPQRLIYNYWRYTNMVTILVTDKDSYLLDNDDLHAGEDNRLAWNFGLTPDQVIVKASNKSLYADKNLWVIIDENDDLYTLDLKTDGSFFEYPITKVNGSEPFKPAPFIGMNCNNNSWSEDMENGNPAVIYDETHSQFLMLTNTANYPQVMEFKSSNLFDNPTGNKTMVCMESTHSGIIKSVLRDRNTNETYYYAMALRAETIEAKYWWMDDEYVPYNTQEGYAKIIGPGVERAEKFSFHGLFPYVFYSVDNKVYQFNLSEPTTPAKEVLSFPGEEIVEMKFFPFVGWVAYQDWERQREYDLVVATNSPTKAQDQCGTVRFYDVPNLMKDLTLKKEVDGFGKIMNIVYKERAK